MRIPSAEWEGEEPKRTGSNLRGHNKGLELRALGGNRSATCRTVRIRISFGSSKPLLISDSEGGGALGERPWSRRRRGHEYSMDALPVPSFPRPS